MKLTSSQDRDAWRLDRGPGGPGGRQRILADLPRLSRGEGYVLGALGRPCWLASHFQLIRTYDSSRTPKAANASRHLALLRRLIFPPSQRACRPSTRGRDRGNAWHQRGRLSGCKQPPTIRKTTHQLTVQEHRLTTAQGRIAELEAEQRSFERARTDRDSGARRRPFPAVRYVWDTAVLYSEGASSRARVTICSSRVRSFSASASSSASFPERRQPVFCTGADGVVCEL